MTSTPLDILRTVFGYGAFRGAQAEIIDHVLAGGEALVLMPTGGGKSLCYQIPAMLRPGAGVVVSPLIALMRDQVEALRQLGVRAAALNSSIPYQEQVEIEWRLKAGELDLVYVAPERLLTDGFLALLRQCRLALFAIDEAHCVSQWGHDFRPEYLQLQRLAAEFPGVPRIACTATADHPTRRDILDRLALTDARVFVAGFDRPNIRYTVVPKTGPQKQLERFIAGAHDRHAGIVYCLSRARAEDVAAKLSEGGRTAVPYHAGLDPAVRQANQDRFLREDGVIVAATIAFGMGIDKPDVRFVAHLGLPKSLEAYYQETGRAGRDGLPADAWMAYGTEDVAKLTHFIDSSTASEQQKHVERQKLSALLGYCETTRCRRQVLLEYFGDSGERCGNCDTCLDPPETFDGTEAAQKLLSCVYRTGQRFGAGHVIDVLMGADTERIGRLGHDRLSTYGIGKGLGKEQWRSVVRQLVALGLLAVDVEGHGGLRLGEDVRPVLRGERRIALRRDPALERRLRRAEEPPARKAAEPVRLSPDDDALFQALRARRLALSKAQSIPPYVIFHDTTLMAMAREKPTRLADLARLPGVGEAKLKRYGDAFLEVITEAAGG